MGYSSQSSPSSINETEGEEIPARIPSPPGKVLTEGPAVGTLGELMLTATQSVFGVIKGEAGALSLF